MTSLMAKEILEIPEVVSTQFEHNAPALTELAEYFKKNAPSMIITLGRGSSDHACTYGKYLFESMTGIPVASAAPSITSLYEQKLQLRNTLVIAVSQSGKSPDIVRYAKAAKEAGATVIGLINVEDSPLAKISDFLLGLKAGPEKSVAATKSYVASLCGFASILATWRGDNDLANCLAILPEKLAEAVQVEFPTFVDAMTQASNAFCLGRGLNFAIAQESALKLKETSQIHAEGFSSAEVLHGPWAIVKENFPILSYLNHDQTYQTSLEVNERMRKVGADVFTIDTQSKNDHTLVLPKVNLLLQPVLQVSAFYRCAEQIAMRRGLNPDQPPHLAKVTETM